MVLKTFASNTFEANTFEAATFGGVSAVVELPPSESIAPRLTLWGNVFNTVVDILGNDVDTVTSGLQIIEKVPYASVMRFTSLLDSRTTCLERIEDTLFQFTLFDEYHENLVKNEEKLIQQFHKAVLGRKDGHVLAAYLQPIFHIEPEIGLYQSSISYSILSQKILSGYHFDSISGTTLYSGLYNRFLSSQGSNLRNKVYGFTTTSFGAGNWDRPFLTVPEYITVEDSATTCDIMDKVSFGIAVEAYDPDEVEEILIEIDLLYSYSGFELNSSRIFAGMNWLGDEVEELEAGLWRGQVNYEMFLQRHI